MSTLGHVFEDAGLATTAIVSNREQAANIAPPRALYCEFPLGRPLGRPRDPAYQRRVLDAAFALLARTDGPFIVDFPDVITDEVDAPLSCPLPPRHDPSVHPAVEEARGLRPAWERAREASGGTQVGRVVDADGVPDAIGQLAEVAEGANWTSVTYPGDDPTTTLMDIRAYYEEAALGLSDHVPAARAAETWYYQSTLAGAVVRAYAEAVQDTDPPFRARNYVIPLSQRKT